jgi:hypothetical protein
MRGFCGLTGCGLRVFSNMHVNDIYNCLQVKRVIYNFKRELFCVVMKTNPDVMEVTD